MEYVITYETKHGTVTRMAADPKQATQIVRDLKKGGNAWRIVCKPKKG
jgi:hypothetical protein